MLENPRKSKNSKKYSNVLESLKKIRRLEKFLKVCKITMKNYIFLTLAWTLVPNKPCWKMAQMEISLSSKYFPYFSSFNNYSNAL